MSMNEFWAVQEVVEVKNGGGSQAPLTRSELNELMEKYPDAKTR